MSKPVPPARPARKKKRARMTADQAWRQMMLHAGIVLLTLALLFAFFYWKFIQHHHLF